MVSGFVVGHGGGALVRAFSLGYGGQAAPVVVGQVDVFQARDPVCYGPAFFVLITVAWRPSGLVVVQVRSAVMNSVVVVLPFIVAVLVSLVWENMSFSSDNSTERVVLAVMVRPEGVVWAAPS